MSQYIKNEQELQLILNTSKKAVRKLIQKTSRGIVILMIFGMLLGFYYGSFNVMNHTFIWSRDGWPFGVLFFGIGTIGLIYIRYRRMIEHVKATYLHNMKHKTKLEITEKGIVINDMETPVDELPRFKELLLWEHATLNFETRDTIVINLPLIWTGFEHHIIVLKKNHTDSEIEQINQKLKSNNRASTNDPEHISFLKEHDLDEEVVLIEDEEEKKIVAQMIQDGSLHFSSSVRKFSRFLTFLAATGLTVVSGVFLIVLEIKQEYVWGSLIVLIVMSMLFWMLTKQNIHKQSIKQAEIMQKTMYFGWKENEIAISRKGPVNSLYTIAYPALKKLNWWMNTHKNGLIVGGKIHNLNQMILIPWYLENRGVPVKKIHDKLKQSLD